MKATARMEDAVSMATGLSTARQLQNRALRKRQMHRAATESCLPPADEGAGRAVGKGGCLVLPTLMPGLQERVERALLPLIIPVTSKRKARQVA